jgi:predicted transcriptional regulator
MIDIAEKVKNIDITNLMTKRVITVTENQALQEASKLMYQNNIGSMIILFKTILEV